MGFIKCGVKILYALYEAEEALYLSEIARMIREAKTSVAQKLSELCKKNIVLEKKRGPRMKFYTLHPEVKAKLVRLESELRNRKFKYFREMIDYLEEVSEEIIEGGVEPPLYFLKISLYCSTLDDLFSSYV